VEVIALQAPSRVVRLSKRTFFIEDSVRLASKQCDE